MIPPLSKKHRLEIAWWLFDNRNLTLPDSISDQELIETFHREADQEWQIDHAKAIQVACEDWEIVPDQE